MLGPVFRGWYVVGCAFVVAVCGWGFGFYGSGVYLAALRALHGWPAALVASAITVYYLASAGLILLVGEAIERWGPRRVVVPGAAAMAAGLVLLTLARAPWHVHGAFLVMALGWATMGGAAINAIVAPWFERRRGLALSAALNGASVGGILVPPLLVFLVARLGFEGGLRVAAAAMLVVVVPAVLLVLRGRPEDAGLWPDGEPRAPSRPAPAGGGPGAAHGPAPGRLARDPAFLTIALPFALGLVAQVGVITHQVSYLLPLVGPGPAALAVSLTATAALVGRTVTGSFIDRVDGRRVSCANFLIQLGGLGVLLAAASDTAVYAGCALFGLGVGNLITLPGLLVHREFPREHFARIVSLVVGVNQFTVALAPTLLGLLRDWSGDYRASFLLCMALQAAAAVVVLRGRRAT